ncbi:MAG: sialate O-acetylesterase [Pirellulaceae bacterium]
MKAKSWPLAILSFIMIATSCLTGPLQAEVKTHRLFSDNMILQRGRKVAVWGTTDKTDDVVVKFAGQTVSAKPENGKWKAALAELEASAQPRDLVISQGDQTLTKKNVLVGDIWLCGGQSNMQWEVHQSAGAAEAIAGGKNPLIRLFLVPREGDAAPRADLKGGDWQEATPDTVKTFSAVGYYFGRDLQANVKVPIGLISSNIGGTTAERWMSKDAIDSNPEIKGMRSPQGRSDLYNAMIAPLASFGVKGAIWYQGESNADRPYNYRHVLSAMIKSWRDTFGQGDLPFFIVELAPFTPIVKEPVDQEWATVRESMQWIASKLPNVDTVSIVDVGDERDIHPQKKQPVGERLARAARAMAYGEKITPAGPEYDSAAFGEGKVVIKFKNVGGGLEAKGGELTGFTIAGEDKQFYNATAKIEGETVVVTCDKVAAPKSVRFGWANYPVVNLWNKDGLPASTFRTDDWTVKNQDSK